MTTERQDVQIGGTHYREGEGEAHWDRTERLKLGTCLSAGTKHIERCYDKGEMREDLLKAQTYVAHALVQLDAGLITPRNPADPDYPAQPTEEGPKRGPRKTRTR